MTADARFPELVSLACHDLRTPLATVSGFAATLLRAGQLDPQSERYVTLIESASNQLGEIMDDLSVLARIEAGRFEPSRERTSTGELADEVSERLGAEKVAVSGDGVPVQADPRYAGRALTALARAALRHGALDRLDLQLAGTSLSLSPVSQDVRAVVLGEQVRDLGAVAGRATIEALGGRVEGRQGLIVISLPS